MQPRVIYLYNRFLFNCAVSISQLFQSFCPLSQIVWYVAGNFLLGISFLNSTISQFQSIWCGLKIHTLLLFFILSFIFWYSSFCIILPFHTSKCSACLEHFSFFLLYNFEYCWDIQICLHFISDWFASFSYKLYSNTQLFLFIFSVESWNKQEHPQNIHNLVDYSSSIQHLEIVNCFGLCPD